MSEGLDITWRDVIERIPWEGKTYTIRTIGGQALFGDGLMHFRAVDVPLDADDLTLGRVRDMIVGILEREAEELAEATA